MGLPHLCGGLLYGRSTILGKIEVYKPDTTNEVTAMKIEVYAIQGLPALSMKTLRMADGTEYAG